MIIKSVQKNNLLKISVYGIIAFCLAILPVLDPYIVCEVGSSLTIRINDIILILLTIYCFIKMPKFDRNNGSLLLLVLILSIINVIACVDKPYMYGITFKNLVIWAIYAIFFAYIWKTPCREKFFKIAEIIGILAVLLIIIQFIGGNLGISVWNGKLPFIELSKYDGWAGYIDKNTGEIRPCGFFQESSYAAIYLSIVFYYSLEKQQLKRAILYGSAILLTSSLMGFLLIGISIFSFLINIKKLKISTKTIFKILFIFTVVVLGIWYLSTINEYIKDVIDYIIKRILNLNSDLSGKRMSSSKYRILGHIYLFNKYNFAEKLFGVGIGQYSGMFGVTSYSNVLVTTILNSGIIGLITLIGYFLNVVKVNDNIHKAYVLLFIAILAFDYQWFSMYFFYLLTACYIKDNNSNQNLK